MNEKARASLQKAVEKFKSGDLSPIVEMAKIKLDPNAPAARWSFYNRMMAFAQTGSVDCRGYRQWQQVGRQVVKGQRAAYILAPRIVKDKESSDPDARKCVGFLTVAVFGYDQTDGENDDAFSYEPRELPPLADVAERLGVKVDWSALPGGLFGYCGNGQIELGSYDPEVFFHELAHAAHRTFEEKEVAGQDPKGEAIAEFVATVLMELYDLGDRTGNAWKYIEQYNADPLKAIQAAAKEIERVLEIILEDEPTH